VARASLGYADALLVAMGVIQKREEATG
jgi:hypothetical protein